MKRFRLSIVEPYSASTWITWKSRLGPQTHFSALLMRIRRRRKKRVSPGSRSEVENVDWRIIKLSTRTRWAHENVNCSLPLCRRRCRISCYTAKGSFGHHMWRNQIINDRMAGRLLWWKVQNYCGGPENRNQNIERFDNQRRGGKLKSGFEVTRKVAICQHIVPNMKPLHAKPIISISLTLEQLFMSTAINFTLPTRRILMQLDVWYDAINSFLVSLFRALIFHQLSSWTF